MLNWQEVDDDQLLKLAKGGDAQAFGEIYERNINLIFGFLFANLDSRLDAEDLSEEVFLRAWDYLPDFDDTGVPFSAFLVRIARNALYDHYRRSKHRANHLDIENVYLVADSDPFEKVSDNFQHEELRQVLDELKDDYRLVLVLRFLKELSPAETAEVMDRSVGAVRVLQHRAINAVRKLLDAGGNDKK